MYDIERKQRPCPSTAGATSYSIAVMLDSDLLWSNGFAEWCRYRSLDVVLRVSVILGNEQIKKVEAC